MRSGHESQEELATVRVGASVGHREHTLVLVTVPEVFVRELSAIDALTASAVAVSEVTTLSHESFDNSMEGRALEVKGLSLSAHTLLAGAESSEVFRGTRRVGMKLHRNAAAIALTDANVEENFSVSLRSWHERVLLFFVYLFD